MLVLKKTSRLGKKRLEQGKPLVTADPNAAAESWGDAVAREADFDPAMLPFGKHDLVRVISGDHLGTKGIVIWVGKSQFPGEDGTRVRVGVKPRRGDAVFVDVAEVKLIEVAQ